MSLAIVTSHYNFAGYSSPRRNLHRWLREMARANVCVYGTELFLAGQTPQTAGLAGWRQHEVGNDAVLWQKEALVNATVRRLPDHYTAAAEIDADLWFESPRWVDDTLAMLARHPAGQPYTSAVWTGPEGEVDFERIGAAAGGFGLAPWRGHTGFAWAFRREFFDAIGGFYDLGILGGADLLWCAAALPNDVPPSGAAMRVGLGSDPAYAAWHARVRETLGGETIGHAPGRVWHEWHGARADRQYEHRPTLLEAFDPTIHVQRHEHGYLTWGPAAPPEMRRRVEAYFAQRREDG